MKKRLKKLNESEPCPLPYVAATCAQVLRSSGGATTAWAYMIETHTRHTHTVLLSDTTHDHMGNRDSLVATFAKPQTWNAQTRLDHAMSSDIVEIHSFQIRILPFPNSQPLSFAQPRSSAFPCDTSPLSPFRSLFSVIIFLSHLSSTPRTSPQKLSWLCSFFGNLQINFVAPPLFVSGESENQ